MRYSARIGMVLACIALVAGVWLQESQAKKSDTLQKTPCFMAVEEAESVLVEYNKRWSEEAPEKMDELPRQEYNEWSACQKALLLREQIKVYIKWRKPCVNHCKRHSDGMCVAGYKGTIISMKDRFSKARKLCPDLPPLPEETKTKKPRNTLTIHK